jgi:hypothetical protein
MRKSTLFFIFLLLLGGLACSQRQIEDIDIEGEETNLRENLYIDSMVFRHYKRPALPYLISSSSYAINDSMSEVLDSMNVETLVKMNSNSRSYDEPLSHTLIGDTLVVDLIHIPHYGRFSFGEIREHGDSIFLKLSGDAFKRIPRIDKKFYVRHRYFRSEFRILIDSAKDYRVYFRHNDSFEKKQ